ncbi:hypothetical protein AERO9A_380019 [Aeromonas salmonicida]|nr:hypothetical protein AERO9A_380019 [Aeromonas salmonicida]
MRVKRLLHATLIFFNLILSDEFIKVFEFLLLKYTGELDVFNPHDFSLRVTL